MHYHHSFEDQLVRVGFRRMRDSTILKARGSATTRSFACRALVSVAIVALLLLSTAAVAHFHFGADAATEAHCPLCMALHNAKHAVTNSILPVVFCPTQTAVLADVAVVAFLFELPLLIQGRAPPTL
jgi:hypothetical protein